ncbi:MAG: substrate-binding domain-containing protein [Deltaproteobacteria bacterium]|nr:substrate-binding domain-containing protein [Deltaproteobacteria bacterium]
MICKKFLVRTLVLALLLSFQAAAVLAAEVKVGAGAAPTENVFKKIQEPMEKETDLKLVLISNGPYEALVDLDQGKVDAASGGLTFGDWLAMMEKKGYQIPDKNAYKYRVIGKDIIQVIAHKGVAVKELSKDQLKGIFTGKIANWKEVGGPDQAIVVIWGTKIPGTQSVFQKQAMDGEAYTKKTQEATNAVDVKEKVKTVPGAVGLAPTNLVDDTVAALKIPEVGRPITLITKGEPNPQVVKMLEYIRGPGKKYLGK